MPFQGVCEAAAFDKRLPPPQYIAFKEGVVWNITQDHEQVQWWLESGEVECYARFEAAEPLVFE